MFILVSQYGNSFQEFTGCKCYTYRHNHVTSIFLCFGTGESNDDFGKFKSDEKAVEVMEQILSAFTNGVTVFKIPQDVQE